MSLERMGVDGDGDLRAVVWGVASAPSPPFGLQQLQADHATMMLGSSSSFAQSVVQKSRSCATIDMKRIKNSSIDSISGRALSSCASVLPHSHSSSSITVTSLDRCTGTLSEVARVFGAASSNSASGMRDSNTLSRKKASSASAFHGYTLSHNRPSFYSDMKQEKRERGTLHGVRSSSSFDLAGAISSMIDETLHFGSSEILHCRSPTTVEGPAFGGCARLVSSEDANLNTSMTSNKLNLSALPMPSPCSMESPPPTQKATVCKQGIKRRKMQQKRIVCVPINGGGRPSGEVLPSDMWAWRKYGQKPIKGSPYPRGYYRCSSSKGCSARKQVERSQTDPSMLILTYTSEHNHSWPAHRNSLAGTTRPKSSPEKSVSTLPSDLAAHPPDNTCTALTNADTSQTSLSGHTNFLGLGQDSSNLDTISRSSSQEEEFFPELDGLLKGSSALRNDFLDQGSDDEVGNVEVDPYNLFCW
ncbi:hypothetical protein O6H91_01G076500 [Diphasiastrum complanatum]|uniref:Uncharacterized protein n=1 Tax=Diphasiastrum complanatum TaxID=34168 RepID=A0ACC2ESD6_DIPCM|nr:hypothetical protein O6H91_01G076500 [Diphasiastrum complanatum]